MCSRRYASSKRGGRKAELNPPALFYNVSSRKASKNDAKTGFCGASPNYLFVLESASRFFKRPSRPGEGPKGSKSRMQAASRRRIKQILNKTIELMGGDPSPP